MKILDIKPLAFPEVIYLEFARFHDDRGYFSETYNFSNFSQNSSMKNGVNLMPNISIKQCNESWSKKNVVRGFHFQFNPFMGKFVRTIFGHMVDIIIDIRPNSKTFGKGIMCDMPSSQTQNKSGAIWIPPGFAHGNYFLKDSIIEYYCTSTYNPSGEIGLFPFSKQIDWSFADKKLYDQFLTIQKKALISVKDSKGIDISDWKSNSNSNCFNK
jgi:dTDP-4-dehydrorhamnose 3,5-epimerase